MTVPASASLTVDKSAVVVRARGEFDFSTCQALTAVLTQAGDAGLPVVVDVADVSFMDAACLGVIARARDKLTLAGLELRVVGAHGVVRRVFELTDLASILSG